MGVGLGLGLIHPEDYHYDARAMVVKIQAEGVDDFLIANTYMYHSEAWTQRNKDIADWVIQKLLLDSRPFNLLKAVKPSLPT